MAKKTAKPPPARLTFNQSLKGCATAELLKRMKALHQELADLDQDLVDTSSINSIAKDLILAPLLLHKDRGVKAYLACCLVDVLRLYAPEAPYTQTELKDLFQFLFRQLKHLSVPTEPNYSEYYYLLESLANVKSIVIICDLDSADELMADVFKLSFDIISSESPKTVEICLGDILLQLIEESATLTPEVIDSLLVQFLPKNVTKAPAAYRLAALVCNGASDKLQRYVCQYFAEVITSGMGGKGEGSDEEESDTSEDDGKGNKKRRAGLKGGIGVLPTPIVIAHTLIKQLNKSAPSLLLNVIPQLEEELTAEKTEYRKLATEILGAMLGEKIGQGDLARKYPNTWKEWLGRHKDKIPFVRIAMLEAFPQIWLEHPELGKDLEATIITIFTDHDDKVRAAAVSVFESISYETARHHVSLKVLKQLGERCTDKKSSIRAIAFKALGRLYSLAFSEIESRDEHAIRQFAWIPGMMYEAVIFGDDLMQASIRSTIDSVNLEYIIPLPKKDDDETAWVDRLLVVVQHLTEKQLVPFFSFTRLGDRRPNAFDAFINASEQNNGGVIDDKEQEIKQFLKQAIRGVAVRLPDSSKVTEDLGKFVKANEKQLYKLIRILVDPQTDLKLLLKTYKEVMRRIESISPTIVDTFTAFVRHCSFLLVNRSSISPLLKRVQTRAGAGTEGEAYANAAVKVLEHVVKHKPTMFKSHQAELTKVLADSPEALVTVALHALSRVAKSDKTTSIDKKTSDRAKHFAKVGTPNQAKYAATVVALDAARPGVADDLVEYLATDLTDVKPDVVVSHLSALGRLARHAPGAYETRSEEITAFALETLGQPSIPEEELEDEEADWIPDEMLADLTRSRVLAIKVLTNRCLAYVDEPESAKSTAEPVFQLLWPLIKPRNAETIYTPPTESRLRYAASLAMLKLATHRIYESSISKNFNSLTRTAQDPCYEVRSGFVTKLMGYLRDSRITSARYFMILLLVAHDPEEEIKTSAFFFLQSRARRLPPSIRQAQLEHPFVRLLHLLAHHPDFSGDTTNIEELKDLAKYVEMYIACIASQENIPYLWHLALKLKTVRDSESAQFDERLYILSDLAQHLLKTKATAEGWAIPTHPQKTLLPGDIFKPLPDPASAKLIAGKSYLSPEVLAEISLASGKGTKRARGESKPRVRKIPASPKQKKSPKPRAPAKVSKKAKKDKWSSGSEGEDDGANDDDSDDDDKEAQGGSDAKKAKKGSKLVPAPSKPSKRAGLRAPANGAPKALKTVEMAEISDLEDDEDEDGNAMDEDDD